MLDELFRIPGLNMPVYGYGVMLVVAFFAAIELGRWLGNRMGLDGDNFATIGLLALVSGVVGARGSHILENLGRYTNPEDGVWGNLKEMVNLSGGGLTYYGGFLFASVVLIAWALWKKMPLRLSMDVIAPCLMVGLGIGRIGCLLHGCCWGATCTVPWAVQFPYGSPPYAAHVEEGLVTVPEELTDEQGRLVSPAAAATDPVLADRIAAQHSLPVHPTQIYSTITAGLIAAICLAFFTIPHSTGQVFALMAILEGGTRFLLETLRIEPAVLGPLSYSMVVGIIVFIIGVVLWLVFAFWRIPAPVTASADSAADPRPALA